MNRISLWHQSLSLHENISNFRPPTSFSSGAYGDITFVCLWFATPPFICGFWGITLWVVARHAHFHLWLRGIARLRACRCVSRCTRCILLKDGSEHVTAISPPTPIIGPVGLFCLSDRQDYNNIGCIVDPSYLVGEVLPRGNPTSNCGQNIQLSLDTCHKSHL